VKDLSLSNDFLKTAIDMNVPNAFYELGIREKDPKMIQKGVELNDSDSIFFNLKNESDDKINEIMEILYQKNHSKSIKRLIIQDFVNENIFSATDKLTQKGDQIRKEFYDLFETVLLFYHEFHPKVEKESNNEDEFEEMEEIENVKNKNVFTEESSEEESSTEDEEEEDESDEEELEGKNKIQHNATSANLESSESSTSEESTSEESEDDSTEDSEEEIQSFDEELILIINYQFHNVKLKETDQILENFTKFLFDSTKEEIFYILSLITKNIDEKIKLLKLNIESKSNSYYPHSVTDLKHLISKNILKDDSLKEKLDLISIQHYYADFMKTLLIKDQKEKHEALLHLNYKMEENQKSKDFNNFKGRVEYLIATLTETTEGRNTLFLKSSERGNLNSKFFILSEIENSHGSLIKIRNHSGAYLVLGLFFKDGEFKFNQDPIQVLTSTI
jgi:hypothetical protein